MIPKAIPYVTLLLLAVGWTSTDAVAENSISELGATGDEFQVNTTTTDSQGQPTVAAEADGDFVVVWGSSASAGTDSDGASVQAQRYASDGSPQGGELQVNTYTTGSQRRGVVAFGADGNFVVVWDSDGSAGTDTSSLSIQARRYASDGSPSGDQFQVNTYTTLIQNFPQIAADADGDFVVIWNSLGSTGADVGSFSVQGQRYASDGSALGDQFQVNSYTTNTQFTADVDAEADGDFVVVWQSYGSADTDSSGFSVQGQRFASDGSPRGGEFQVNTYTTGNQGTPSVAVESDGAFVVVWDSEGSSGSDATDHSVQGQRYASDGSAIGDQFQVNSYTTSRQVKPTVAWDDAGTFMVTWESGYDSLSENGPDGSDESIQGQRYAADGSAVGDEFQINSYTTETQETPQVAGSGQGDGVQATRMPVAEFEANWAYIVVGALAWNLKSWTALMLPDRFGACWLLNMEFRTFPDEVMLVPTQILRSGRRLIYRVLSINRWTPLLLDGTRYLRRMKPV
ncbi:MAG: hypothetical protein MPN21_20320 [Thermoanaerobaculia bacterium]|nr:hypothetical protein [Thermoanaerobaculia bacterium]